ASFNYIIIMVFIGTALLLILIRFRLFKIWKAWFFLAIWGALSISFSVVMGDTAASIIALLLAYLKTYRGNAIIHNLTEIFIYPGIAIMISPIFNVYWAIMLLIAISIYDMIAVWKSKHMVKLAKAQSENKMFSGLMIPYVNKEKKQEVKLKMSKNITKGKTTSAILGGGDIAFPMIFAGSVMTSLIESGASKEIAFFKVLIISLFSGIALFGLFLKSQKGKFYPAMPFITAGCFIGYAIILLL
ncbi:MAG: presenilin family intramembrane aspartyl protease, partial [Nanoarchaeota archaeon]